MFKGLVKRLLFKLSGNRPAQRLLEWNVNAAQYFMGIGSGSIAGSSGEDVLGVKLRALHAETRVPVCVFDVGANQGQFLAMITGSLDGMPFSLHAFEPGRTTFESLQKSSGNIPGVTLNNVALGDAAGARTLFYQEAGSGVASLYQRRLEHFGTEFNLSEVIQVDTLDDYCARQKVQTIDLLKLDVEGHELQVLRGGERMLRERRIRMVSFEFGGCNIDSRTFLQDFYYFLNAQGLGRIFRITPAGFLMPIGGYREIHEQFRTTNFLALPSAD